MNSKKDTIDIKSVTIRSLHIKRRLLMSSSTVAIFESFLKENIGDEVLVVNTNIGMEVYYYSKNDYSTFIKESVLLYTLKHIDQSKLKFRNNSCREKVYQSFCEALMTFAQYPQIFLAYTKKFIHIKKKNKSNKHLIPILNKFFEEVLNVLKETNRMPHSEKIERAKNKSQKPSLDQSLIKSLISEILLKSRYN